MAECSADLVAASRSIASVEVTRTKRSSKAGSVSVSTIAKSESDVWPPLLYVSLTI